MDLKKAQARQPEILRSVQKDAIYTKELAADYSDVLHLFGTKPWIKYNEFCDLFAAITYHGFTSINNLQTLGEEYTGIIQITNDFKRIPARWLSAIILEFGGDTLYQKLLKKTELYISTQEDLEDTHKENLLYWLHILRTATPYIQSLHKSLFYLNSNKYQLSKRLTGINYVLVRHWLAPEYSLYGYKILGFITLFQLLFSLGMNSWINWCEKQRKTIINNNNDNVDYSKEIIENGIVKISNADCVLCLEACHDISVTPCGHLYCWSCILEWLDEREECPLCRETLQKSRIIILQNYN